MAENSSLREHAGRWTLLAALILGAAGASYAIWSSVSEQAGVRHEGPGFAVVLPGTPTEERVSNEGEWGAVEVHRLMLEPEGQGPSYRVEYYDYPPGPLEFIKVLGQTEGEMLPVASGRALADELQGEVSSEIPLALDGHKGNEVTIDGPDGRTTIARIYLVKRRLYVLRVTTPSADAFQSEIGEFFDSFELLEPSAS